MIVCGSKFISIFSSCGAKLVATLAEVPTWCKNMVTVAVAIAIVVVVTDTVRREQGWCGFRIVEFRSKPWNIA